MTLLKATLCEVSADAAGTEVGTPVDVQFNPTTLRVQMTNKTAGGAQAGSQPKQKAGEGTTTLSLELVFDTADEGTTESPVPVTKKTALVEKFVRPRGTQPSQQTPPRVQFKWNGFVMKGVMESLSVDIDHFAEDGTPLRAKCAISIKGQDPAYAYKEGEGSGGGAKPPTPAQAAAGAGAAPTPDKIAPALDGESLSQFASRMGLDPSAWRALAEGISNPLSLSAGVEIAFSSSLNLSVGVGISAGVSLGANADVSAKVGLGATSGGGTGAGSGTPDATTSAAASKALTEAGGVAAAITAVKQAQNSDQVAATKQSFGNAAGAGATAARASQRASTASAAAVSAANEDARAYGAGVPLRPLRAIPVPDSIGGYIVAGKPVIGGAPPTTSDPTVPAWVALPASALGQLPSSSSARGGVRHKPSLGCGCSSCGGKS